jgi:nucleoside-diphosphate-sugar epimerase
MNDRPTTILGCGFTGRRVAKALLARGRSVTVTTRSPEGLADLAAAGARVLPLDLADPEGLLRLAAEIPTGAVVLHSVPAKIDGLEALGDRVARMVLISTTGVYGDQKMIDASTPAAATTPRQVRRYEMEEQVTAGPWASMILRPAAIYGPGRGLHVMMREGRYRMAGDGSNFVSRIHVEDLARIATAALDSDLTGAWPVADREPATSKEVAEYVAGLLGLPKPLGTDPSELPETMRVTRQVDGSAVRGRLGVELLYPTYREGIPAALREEG